MTTKAFFHQSGAYSAADLRWFVEQFAPYVANGCVRNGLTVTFNGSNRLQVAAGHGFLGPTNTLFAVTVDGTTDATKSDGSTANWAPSSNGTGRVDVVYIKVTDTQLDGTSNLARVEYVLGTDGSTTVPTPSGRYLKLAEVRSASSALSSITDCRNVRTFDTPSGAIQLYAGDGATPPDGWLLCNGAAVSRTGYAALYAAIGTTYGAGNGSTTFNLPDLRDRVPVGVSGTKARGSTGGAATVTLTTDQIPSHTHGHDESRLALNAGTLFTAVAGGTPLNEVNEDRTTDAAGGGQAHENMPPYIALNYLIKT